MPKLISRLKQAEKICQQQRAQLTSLRREILALIYQEAQPISAYELLRQLRISKPNAEPPTIYRALEFLQKQHLVHRIEKDNTYVACEYPHEAHSGYFLICKSCGSVNEMNDAHLQQTVAQCAIAYGFTIENCNVEISGQCQKCKI